MAILRQLAVQRCAQLPHFHAYATMSFPCIHESQRVTTNHQVLTGCDASDALRSTRPLLLFVTSTRASRCNPIIWLAVAVHAWWMYWWGERARAGHKTQSFASMCFCDYICLRPVVVSDSRLCCVYVSFGSFFFSFFLVWIDFLGSNLCPVTFRICGSAQFNCDERKGNNKRNPNNHRVVCVWCGVRAKIVVKAANRIARFDFRSRTKEFRFFWSFFRLRRHGSTVITNYE